ncbi:O-antigen ligase family protein [Fimbriimonas ginsengisoli]|uniref:O-antigen ligase-related domain-containing protein n=1 Tax=Fimbriimonas ginsengisoli Gsoil 348 TaxID=661478 RepID=A0A068NU36_FIMGI|nr:O-antigen ligase family protein [Fimbriimonas ginsengisoli]AIE86956.1 hypothetical protein OP10G_3588 [Fimbriimonas ginsengisoli Gsoil 348]
MKRDAKRAPLGIPAILLVIAAFLAPIIGGQVSTDATSLTSGFGEVVGSFFTSPGAPYTSHTLLALLCGAAFMAAFLGRRVVQVPNNLFAGFILVMLGVFAATCAFSNYKPLSIAIAAEWLSYGVALYAVVAVAGRKAGPMAIISAIFAGSAVTAIYGILEYGATKAADPSWRIFSFWVNPNALAAILLVGFCLGLGVLTVTEQGAMLATASGLLLISFALALTGSKGAMAILAICLVAHLVLTAFLSPKEQTKAALGRIVAVVGCAIVAVAVLVMSQSGQKGGTGAMSRIANAGATVEQSAHFRWNLWLTAGKLFLRNPVGSGPGTFRFESGRPGLTTQTVFAHSTYAQLLAEASPLVPLLLVIAIGYWVFLALRASKSLPPKNRALLISVVVAVGAACGHSVFDSDFYYYGLGLSVFMLLGTGLLLSGDSVAPEFLFPALRRLGAGFVSLLLLVMLYSAYTELLRSEVRGDIQAGKVAEAQATLDTLHSIAPNDGEAWYLTSNLSGRLEDARQAAAFAPRTKYLRRLALLQAQSGQTAEAMATLDQALATDPNNPDTLYQAAQLALKGGDQDRYASLLKRLVATENTPYFKVRSVPEDVEVQTFIARLELAKASSDAKEQRTLLRPAVQGFKSFLASTVPQIVANGTYNGRTVEGAKEILQKAAEAARMLQGLDLAAGDKAAADDDVAAETAFLGGIK